MLSVTMASGYCCWGGAGDGERGRNCSGGGGVCVWIRGGGTAGEWLRSRVGRGAAGCRGELSPGASTIPPPPSAGGMAEEVPEAEAPGCVST